MKRISLGALAAGLAALSACGDGAANNAATNSVGDEVYNVAPDDLGAEPLPGNEGGANLAGGANVTDGNLAGDANLSVNAQ